VITLSEEEKILFIHPKKEDKIAEDDGSNEITC
jgi:hypothetical protein